jgi:hypothetical protein
LRRSSAEDVVVFTKGWRTFLATAFRDVFFAATVGSGVAPFFAAAVFVAAGRAHLPTREFVPPV